MPTLIPIQYRNHKYPNGIKANIKEIAGNFDSSTIDHDGDYSLHTEYSYASRKFDNSIIKKYETICCANKKGVPMLWYSLDWANEFVEFILDFTRNSSQPRIIEIHPPFSDYCDIDSFMEKYTVFEKKINNIFNNTIILLENRSGTIYKGGEFIISKIDQIIELSDYIDKNDLDLRITLDLPQLLTAYKINKFNIDLLDKRFNRLKAARHNIYGIHLWGKRKSQNGRLLAHVGDLNSYFDYDENAKNFFIDKMFDLFDDNIARFFVPEVNSSGDDHSSIIIDLLNAGFEFE